MANVKQFVDEGIKNNRVMMYGKSYCPVSVTVDKSCERVLTGKYCQRAKKLIAGETSEFEYIDLDHRDDGCEWRI
jgi:glutaredoxin 3